MPTITAAVTKDAGMYVGTPAGGTGVHSATADPIIHGEFTAKTTTLNGVLAQFDLSGIPAGATVLAATLNVYQASTSTGTPPTNGTGPVRRVTSVWNEVDAAAGSPSYDAATLWGTITFTTGAVGWRSTSVQALVAAWFAGTYNNRGLLIDHPAAEHNVRNVGAREGTNDPYLSITYNRAPGQPGVLTSPLAGTTWGSATGEVLHVEWPAAVDPDADALTYEVEGSVDGGATWLGVSGLAATLARDIAIGGYPATTTGRVRVRAYDGTTYGAWRESGNFSIVHNAAPNQPAITTVMGAANGGTADLAAGGAIVVPFTDPDAGDTPSAIYLRRKVGAGAWEWYNGATAAWQAAEVKIAQAVSGFTWPAAKFANGTTYQLGVAYEDALGVKSPYSADFTVTGGLAPTVSVDAPADPVTTTSFPVVEWTMADAEGDDQERVQLRIEHGAFGIAPGAGIQDYGPADIVSATDRDHQVPVELIHGTTYRAFVRVRANGQWSGWAYRTFTMNLTRPSAPTIVVTEQPDLGRTRIVVTGTHVAAAFPGASAVVKWLDGAVWREVRDGEAAYDGALSATIYDVEAPLNRTRIYQAQTKAVV